MDLKIQQHDDHEAKMASAELYKLNQYSAKLFKMIGENDELDGWVQSKITKAADYISSVYHYMDYDEKFNQAELENNIPVQQVVKPSDGKMETYEEVLFKILDKKVNEKKSNQDKK